MIQEKDKEIKINSVVKVKKWEQKVGDSDGMFVKEENAAETTYTEKRSKKQVDTKPKPAKMKRTRMVYFIPMRSLQQSRQQEQRPDKKSLQDYLLKYSSWRSYRNTSTSPYSCIAASG